jgi:hypothetical protein
MRRFFPVIMVLIIFSLASACGGGGGGGNGGGPLGPALTEFAGDWFGPGNDGGLDPFEVGLTMDGSGGISAYNIDSVSQSNLIPATFVVEDESSALITFFDSSEGGMFWDDAVQHILFVDSGAEIAAVVQKNAVALPSYAASDAVDSWSGYAYIFSDGIGDFEKESPVLLTVANDLSFSGTDPTNQPFTGSFNASLFDSSHGMYVGTVNASIDQPIQVVLSPDKTFFGGVLLKEPPFDAFPWDYIFLVLTRQ